ncbi:MAG: phage tail protein [Allosphingosinicella sp.]
MAAKVRARAGKAARDHAPAKHSAAAAQAAALDPATEQKRGAAHGTVVAIDSAETKPVDRQTFRQQLREALAKAVPEPKTESEAEDLKATGAVKASAALSGQLQTQTSQATGGLGTAAQPAAELPGSAVPAPPAAELVPEQAGPAPAPIGAAAAVPLPVAPPDFLEDRAPTDKAMADANVTQAQMARSNEPDFTATVQAREGAEQQEAKHAQQFGAGQAGILAKQTGATGAMLAGGMGGIHDKRGSGLGAVAGKQSATKAAEAAERTRITNEIDRIKIATREDVVRMLDDMEKAATLFFETGLGLAEKAYSRAFDDAKGGAVDWLTNWGDDWKEHLEAAFRTARAEYDRIVSETIESVADIVETRLALATARVQRGRKEVDLFVEGLDKSVRGFGEETRTAIGADFDAMEGEIDAKRDSIVESLVDKYRESQKRVAALEEQLREANKSIWERIYDATVGIIKKIIAFKDFLLGVLAKMAQVVAAIIDDPIGFLGNLIGGIMAGLDGFMSRIGEHLKKGLLEWLFGALEGAGLKIPETFDMKGILDLVLQVLGLTWANIRARAVKVLGADMVAYLEKSWEIFQVLVKEGPAGLWKMLVEKLGDIKEMILTQVGQWVEEKIITAGIKWLLSLLNPVAAFIKACMAIYDIVKFFIERAAQIAALINAILDTLGAIVGGNVSAMAKSVENALAKMIPVAIGFLASLLGLGGISEKIRSVIAKLQAPVNAAIDWIIGKAAGMVKKVGGAIAKAIKGTDKRTPAEKQRDLERAAASLRPLIKPLLKRGISPEKLKPLLVAWRLRYRLTSLALENGEIVAVINPRITLVKGWTFEDTDLFKIVDKLAAEFIEEAKTEAAAVEPTIVKRTIGGKEQDIEQSNVSTRMSLGKAVVAIGSKNRHEVTVGTDDTGTPVTFGHSREQAPFGGWFGWQGIGSGGAGGPKGRRYDEIAAALKDKPVGDWLGSLARGKPLPAAAKPHKGDIEELYGLLLAKEPSHAKGDQRRDLVYSAMAVDLMSGPEAMPVEAVVGTGALHPAAFGGAQSGAKVVTAEVLDKKAPAKMTDAKKTKAAERRRRERETLREWFKKHKDKLPLLDHKPTLKDVEDWVRKMLREFMSGSTPAAEETPAVPDAELKEP